MVPKAILLLYYRKIFFNPSLFFCSEGLPPLCTTPEKRQGSLGLPISRKIIFVRVKFLYTMQCFGKNGPNLPDYERKKSKVAILREYVPTIHQFIRGILSFSTSPFDVKPNLALLFCMITNQPASQI
jgi:hypothetical protein